MHWWNGSALVQIMACRLDGTKPLSEPMVTYCQLEPKEHISMKFYLKFIYFHSRKCIWTCCLQNGSHFVQGGWVNSLTLLVPKLEYSMITRLIPWLLMPWLLLWCWLCRIMRLFLVFHKKKTFQLPTPLWNYIKFKSIFIFPKINSARQELNRSTSDICDVLVIFWMHDNVNLINKYWS